MIRIKNRKLKQQEYQDKYGDIPIDYQERLSWMVDHYNVNEKKMEEIISKRNNSISNLFFYECKVVQLLEEPEGTPRPRFRIINKSNFNQAAIESQFVHVYTPNAKDDYLYMHELTQEELLELNGFINTPCVITYDAYYKTPTNSNINDVFLNEIGLFRPNVNKPDWDNLGKKYCDMYNHNVWLDDSLVISGTVNKYYSILPRIEIKLKYLNAVYNKKQYTSIINRKDYDNRSINYLDNQGRIINGNGN